MEQVLGEALHIKVRIRENPLLFKYDILLGFTLHIIFGVICTTFLLRGYFMIQLIVIAAVVLGAILNLFYSLVISMETILDNDSLQYFQKVLFLRKKQVLNWNNLLPLIQKIEYQEKYKGVIIYTTLFGKKNETSFSPMKYFYIAPNRMYPNIFIPVNNVNEGEQVVQFINAKLNKSQPPLISVQSPSVQVSPVV